MKHKYLIIIIFISSILSAGAQDQAAYIRQYQDLAVSEMLRTGIPASIKLAQAILESSCGKSDLACKANNHFGIKCGGEWRGKSFHKEDDDYEEGKLVKSCFREFNSVMDSYIAHSDFLSDPNKANRYGSLFNLDVTDYKGWARGLSKAGYATDPQYANRLIEIIEKYELFRFDNETETELASASPKASSGYNLVRYNNDVKYALAMAGDNPVIVANRHDVSVNQLLRYNDNIYAENQQLASGVKMYLQPKKTKYHGKQKYHLLKKGEDMTMVSQQYGIKLDALLKRNGLERSEVPQPNQKIVLKGKVKNEFRKVDPYQMPSEKKPTGTKTSPASKDAIVSANPGEMTASTGGSKDTQNVNTAKNSQDSAHMVSKGETLYGIARTYGLSVDELKKRNNLSVDTIFVGQKLILK
jgi:LysM repeat protein